MAAPPSNGHFTCERRELLVAGERLLCAALEEHGAAARASCQHVNPMHGGHRASERRDCGGWETQGPFHRPVLPEKVVSTISTCTFLTTYWEFFTTPIAPPCPTSRGLLTARLVTPLAKTATHTEPTPQAAQRATGWSELPVGQSAPAPQAYPALLFVKTQRATSS